MDGATGDQDLAPSLAFCTHTHGTYSAYNGGGNIDDSANFR